MNCFVGDVQTNRGAIRRANHFQSSVWGWTGGRCTTGTCNVLYKGTVPFSCVLKLLSEMEADFAEAEEPRASSASACSGVVTLAKALTIGHGEIEIIALCQTSGWISPPLPGWRSSQRGDEGVSSIALMDFSPGNQRWERRRFGKLRSRREWSYRL